MSFALRACHCHRHRSLLDAILYPFGRLLERLGVQLELFWSHLQASRATLGVFWTVSGGLQGDHMILGTKIIHFGPLFGIQNRRNIGPN